ncbi:MAG: hypothetical protein Q7U04_05390 [Bacteriovorax sp.]|nr:hypothetical protein [Bacteriovorax sp.]
MKVFGFSLFIYFTFLLGQLSAAEIVKKKNQKKNISKKTIIAEDKVYAVEKASPEIILGDRERQAVGLKNNTQRPEGFWFVSITRSSLKYKIPSFSSNVLEFSPDFAGFIIGKKISNQFFLYRGYYEISGEWQRFNREGNLGSNTLYSQKLDLYQVNLFQNFNIFWSLKYSLLCSVGIGIAPVFLTTQQSVFSNSTSDLGYMGMIKGNIDFPITHKYEVDLFLKTGWGALDSREISETTLGLGLNFE